MTLRVTPQEYQQVVDLAWACRLDYSVNMAGYQVPVGIRMDERMWMDGLTAIVGSDTIKELIRAYGTKYHGQLKLKVERNNEPIKGRLVK